jgi:Fic family protein
MRKTGTYQILGYFIMGTLNYFTPDPLPPSNPPLAITSEIMTLYGEALFFLGQLNEIGSRLPNPERLSRAYVIKEALLSSEIEGIHTTLIDVFTAALDEGTKPNKNTQLVLNYTKALDVVVNMVKKEGFPIVSRVILGAHEALLSEGENEYASPGLYRKQSVRVGELVPPPAQEIPNLMSALFTYINEPSELPPLIRAGLVHVQFETIHPFLDGNGRIGRLLIVLMLMDNGLLSLPILYPSYYFKKNRFEYYQRLDQVRTHGDFEGWIIYYLKAIRDSASDAHTRAKEIEALEIRLKDMIQTDPQFIRMRDAATAAVDFLFVQPVTNIAEMSKALDKAYNTVHNILKRLIELGLVAEDSTRKRNKLYRFVPYLAVLEKEY